MELAFLFAASKDHRRNPRGAAIKMRGASKVYVPRPISQTCHNSPRIDGESNFTSSTLSVQDNESEDIKPWENLRKTFGNRGSQFSPDLGRAFYQNQRQLRRERSLSRDGSDKILKRKMSDMATQTQLYHCRACRSHIKFGKGLERGEGDNDTSCSSHYEKSDSEKDTGDCSTHNVSQVPQEPQIPAIEEEVSATDLPNIENESCHESFSIASEKNLAEEKDQHEEPSNRQSEEILKTTANAFRVVIVLSMILLILDLVGMFGKYSYLYHYLNWKFVSRDEDTEYTRWPLKFLRYLLSFTTNIKISSIFS